MVWRRSRCRCSGRGGGGGGWGVAAWLGFVEVRQGGSSAALRFDYLLLDLSFSVDGRIWSPAPPIPLRSSTGPPLSRYVLTVLRADKNADVVRLPWTFVGMFTGRYALQSGKRLLEPRWKQAWFAQTSTEQQQQPVALLQQGKRCYWWFHDCIYWDDDSLLADDVKALVLQRERSAQRKLQTAHSLMRAEEEGRPTRAPVPVEIRRAVFERDGGSCVECDSNFDLQYDHILPVARGGATTVENMQLLCADCNQRKSDSL